MIAPMPDEATNDNIDFYRFAGFMLLILAIAPLYYQNNLGGRGLELTFNIAVWAAATSLICFTTVLITIRKSIRLPARVLCFVAVPIVIVIQSILTGASQPDAFLFRELYLVGGLFFFIALFQFRLRPVQIEWILLILAFSKSI